MMKPQRQSEEEGVAKKWRQMIGHEDLGTEIGGPGYRRKEMAFEDMRQTKGKKETQTKIRR